MFCWLYATSATLFSMSESRCSRMTQVWVRVSIWEVRCCKVASNLCRVFLRSSSAFVSRGCKQWKDHETFPMLSITVIYCVLPTEINITRHYLSFFVTLIFCSLPVKKCYKTVSILHSYVVPWLQREILWDHLYASFYPHSYSDTYYNIFSAFYWPSFIFSLLKTPLIIIM